MPTAKRKTKLKLTEKKAVALMQGKLKLSLNPKNKQVVFEEAE